MKNIVKTIAFATLLTATVFANGTLAVLEIVPSSDMNDMKVNIQEMRHLTDELRRQAVLALPDKGYKVLTRDNIISLLPEDEEAQQCLAESCAVDIGRAIGAEFISSGSIGLFSGDLTLTIELYESLGGKLLGSIVMESPDVRGLLNAIRTQAPALFARITKNNVQDKPASPAPQAPLAQPAPAAQSQANIWQWQDAPQTIPTNVEQPKQKFKIPSWVAIGLDVIGVAALGMGYYFDMKAGDYHKDYKNMAQCQSPEIYATAYQDVEDAKKMRNISYGLGGVFLLGGVALHIWF